jgi:glucan biosynthesis protein C
MTGQPPISRRYDIDWLRNLAVLLLIPFHTARIFDVWEPNYAKNADLSRGLSLFISFVDFWHMPLLFLLAGAASWYALEKRSGKEYLSERFKRLFIPLVFGILVIIPPQPYFAYLTQGQDPGTYLHFLSHYFVIIPSDLSGYFGTFTPAHLWFILYLFVFAVVAIPLLLWLKRENSAAFIDRSARFFSKPGLLFLLAIPLWLSEALPDPGGKNPFTDILYFLYGYILVADPRFQASIRRNSLPALVLGLLGAGAIISVWYLRLNTWQDWSTMSIVFALLRKLTALAWLIVILDLGQRYLNFGHPVLKYTNEAAYPFYILHQTVIILIGYYVVTWSANLWLKFFVIMLAALVATLAIYDIFVRRTTPTRFLFGMKSIRKARDYKAPLTQPYNSE